MQYRVSLQRARLAELTAPGRRLTVAEAREIFRLREMESRRRANRAWRDRGNNAERCRSYCREWRQANPGC